MSSGPRSISPSAGITAMAGAQAAAGRVLIPDQLSLHRPSELLLAIVERVGLPDPSNTNSDYLFLRQRIKELAERHLESSPRAAENFAVFGCGEFSDIPIDDWLGRGAHIYGIDIVNTGIRDIKRRFSGRGGERLIEVNIDASLFASTILGELAPHLAALARDPSSRAQFPNKFIDLHRQALAQMPTRQLPFYANSLDLAVSSLAINDFLNGYYNLVRMLLEDFYLGHTIQSGQEADAFKRLMGSSQYGKLKKAAFKAHVRELRRIVRRQGLAIIATHILEFQAEQIPLQGISSFRINPNQGADFLTGQASAIKVIDRSSPTARLGDAIDVRVGAEESRYALSEESLLDRVIREETGIRILNQEFFCMVRPQRRALTLAKMVALRVS